ncbi:MAG: alanine racemase [Propionibacteriaceae bacterium]
MDADYLDWRDKGLWLTGEPMRVADFVAAGHTLFDGSLNWPVMVLREEALASNLATLARFCSEHGLAFAPHGKTTMAPRLYERQLAAGAWGITVATVHQARIARNAGVPRVLLANQVLDAGALATLAAELVTARADDPSADLLFFVDSVEGVQLAAEIGAAHPDLDGGLSVLLDIGYPGGRTGVRTPEQAVELAGVIADSPGVTLRGIASYEGGLKVADEVRDFFAVMRDCLDRIVSAGLVGPHPVVSSGGSAWFDLVVSELAGDWSRSLGVRVILRSGAYLTHDHGTYERSTPYNRITDEGHLEPAIEVWAQVNSAPEPGLALVGMGRRDAPFDAGMPVPLWLRRAGTTAVEDISGRAEVPKMNDQHGYLHLGDDLQVRPGDLVCFGISHPCTAFDKWRVLPVLDADDRVVDVVRTWF